MLAKKCSTHEMGLIAITARNIWTRKNIVLHGGPFTHPNQLVQESKESLGQFLEANENQGILIGELIAAGAQLKCWRQPPLGFYKINWDVGINDKNKG